MRLTRLADVPPVPWRNGGGSTRVLASDSSGAQDGQFAWRISLAEIAGDGEFSAYLGVDRQLLACGPATWELVVDGQVNRMSPLDLVRFQGEARAAARLLTGPAAALNVMTLRGQADARLETVRVRESYEQAARDHVSLVVILDGSFTVDGTDPRGLKLGDSIMLQPLETVRLVGLGVIADVAVRRLPSLTDLD